MVIIRIFASLPLLKEVWLIISDIDIWSRKIYIVRRNIYD